MLSYFWQSVSELWLYQSPFLSLSWLIRSFSKLSKLKNKTLYLIQTQEPAACTVVDRSSLHTRAWESPFEETPSAAPNSSRALKQPLLLQECRKV